MSARDNNCWTSITLSFEQLRLKLLFDLETHKRGSPVVTPSPQTLQRRNERGGLALRCDMARWAWPQHSPSAVQRLPSSHYCSSLNLMTSLAKICQHRPLQSSIGGELSAHFQASLWCFELVMRYAELSGLNPTFDKVASVFPKRIEWKVDRRREIETQKMPRWCVRLPTKDNYSTHMKINNYIWKSNPTRHAFVERRFSHYMKVCKRIGCKFTRDWQK